jgi:hypothetical protein
MAENQLADSGSLGDVPYLRDIGERGRHPFELGPSGTVTLEISKIGDLVDQDVGVMCDGRAGQPDRRVPRTTSLH